MTVGQSKEIVQLIDTAGQEQYNSLLSNYIKNVSLVVQVYDASLKPEDYVKQNIKWTNFIDDYN